MERTEAIDHVATELLPRASVLTRLLLRSGSRTLSRAEAGLLSTLTAGPRRVSDLADTEALAQPTVTQMVDRLEARGLVARERSPRDGRVVLVSLSGDGREQLERLRAEYRTALRRHVDALPDEELAALAGATDALGRLVEALQR